MFIILILILIAKIVRSSHKNFSYENGIISIEYKNSVTCNSDSLGKITYYSDGYVFKDSAPYTSYRYYTCKNNVVTRYSGCDTNGQNCNPVLEKTYINDTCNEKYSVNSYYVLCGQTIPKVGKGGYTKYVYDWGEAEMCSTLRHLEFYPTGTTCQVFDPGYGSPYGLNYVCENGVVMKIEYNNWITNNNSNLCYNITSKVLEKKKNYCYNEYYGVKYANCSGIPYKCNEKFFYDKTVCSNHGSCNTDGSCSCNDDEYTGKDCELLVSKIKNNGYNLNYFTILILYFIMYFVLY